MPRHREQVWSHPQYGSGSLPYFRGARVQRGYGLGSMLKGIWKSAVPLLKAGTKYLGKRALQTGVNVAQDVMAGKSLKTASAAQAKKIKRRLVESMDAPPVKRKTKKKNDKKVNKKTRRKKKAFIYTGSRPVKRSNDIFDRS